MDGEQRWRSHTSFGLFRDDQENIRRNAPGKSRRFRLSFAVVAVALLIVTGVFIALQVTKTTRDDDDVSKEKRFAEEPKMIPQTDVDVIPEGKPHPNHRYDEGEPGRKDKVVERIMKNVYREWETEDEPKARNNIRDIIKRIEMREKLRKAIERRNPRGGMGQPIRFKGVYTKTGKADGVSADDSYREHFKEINEMLMGEEKSPSEEKGVHSLRGSPFQLRNQVGGWDETTEKGGDEMWRKTKKPITVLLDIYPITKPEEEVDEMAGRKKKRKKKNNEEEEEEDMPFLFSEPVSSGGRNIGYAVAAGKGGRLQPKKRRMIMKLNLYPKAGDEPGISRRTFGWFKKKPEAHVCQLVGHGSGNGWKPVTAEWKDEHGDWIKANYVTLNYWD